LKGAAIETRRHAGDGFETLALGAVDARQAA
jgi:hypothetical protein